MRFEGKHGDAAPFQLLKEALAHFCSVLFCSSVSSTFTAVSNVWCFCWHRKVEAGELNRVAGKHQAHSYGSKYLEESGCSSVCILFWMV